MLLLNNSRLKNTRFIYRYKYITDQHAGFFTALQINILFFNYYFLLLQKKSIISKSIAMWR